MYANGVHRTCLSLCVYTCLSIYKQYISAVSRVDPRAAARLCCNKQSLNMQTNLIECLVWRYNGMAPGLIMFAAHTNTGAHTQREGVARLVWWWSRRVQGDIPLDCPRST